MAATDRTTLRATFDTVPDAYDRVRPSYPEELFDTLIEAAGLAPGDRVLEIGPGPGKATRGLAGRGLRVTGLELGAELAAAARRNLADLDGVEIVDGDFDVWEPPAGVAFDLVAAATAWHWPDPDTKYARAAAMLRPGGHLAFWAALHARGSDPDPFVEELTDVYRAIGFKRPEHHRGGWDGLADNRAEIESSGRFEVTLIRRFTWESVFDADGYIALADTFSSHIAMSDEQRATLYAAIRERLARRPDGRLRYLWGSVLHVARRLDS